MRRQIGRKMELAARGGPKTRARPFPVRRLFGAAERRAVSGLFDAAERLGHQVLGYNGPQEEAYGREFAASLGGGYADGVNSGTNALWVALRALKLEPFSEVIVPAVTDPGGVMPVALCNCIPVPADCAVGSYNVGARQIEARRTRRTRAIVVAHIAGLPADMDPILRLARQHKLRVVEDCAQCHGATYRGRAVGTFGDVAVFSMMFGKHHASGGQGGMVFTRSADLYGSIRRHADRGKPFGLDKEVAARGNIVAGLNCNMDELHAAIGRVQLRKLPGMVARRRRLAQALGAGCRRDLKAVRLVEDPPRCKGSYWFLFFRLEPRKLRVDKKTFVSALAAEGIPAGASYLVIPARMPWFRDRAVFGSSGLPWTGLPDRQAGLGGGRKTRRDFLFPNAEAADAAHFRMSFHEGWTMREVEDVLSALRKLEAAFLR